VNGTEALDATEDAVLGAAMSWPDDCAEAVLLGLLPDHFRSSRRATVWRGIQDLFASGHPTDVVSVVQHLESTGQLEAVGGPLVVRAMGAEALVPGTIRHHVGVVTAQALTRRIQRAAADILAAAENPNGRNLAEVAEEAISTATLTNVRNPLIRLADGVSSAVAKLEGGPLEGTPTGIGRIDSIIGGLLPGQLVIVGARTGMGKSALVTQIARNVANLMPVMFVSLEMSHHEVCFRLLCAESRLPWVRVRAHQLTSEEWTRLIKAETELETLPLFILDQGGRTVSDIRSRARRMRREGLGLIVVDYVQLMTQPGIDSRQYEVAAISSALKMLARELDIPVILVGQLNRGAEDHDAPRLSDLRDSGQLEQDADVVMLISRPPKEEGTRINVTIAKQRNGPSGVTAKLHFRPEFTTFTEPLVMT
jgi:replicative DNA helicase